MSAGAVGAQQHGILNTGISVVYEPQDLPPVVDIVIVHGLHGHPYKSWTAKAPSAALASPTTSFPPLAHIQDEPKDKWWRKLRRFGLSRSKSNLSTPETGSRSTISTKVDECDAAHEHEHVFWPADLLPEKCPQARVLTFGYDSKITKYMSGATNKGSLLTHGRDLLFSICRNRVPNRPVIFVAHSLGGIVVKEMLERSATAIELELRNVVESTAAVIFLGTPHRGSPDLAAMGEYLRSIISGLRMETTPAIIDALSLKTTDLERAQEAFSKLWQQHNFRVKSFQEGLGISGVSLGVLSNKVVPDYSSSIGDHRERCETLQANHKEMCRFTGHNDANWRKVSGELCHVYLSILNLHSKAIPHERDIHQHLESGRCSQRKSLKINEEELLGDYENASLESLWFPSMYTRLRRVEKPAEQTCSWLFEHRTYDSWFAGRNQYTGRGLVLLKGKPGTGKSILMKEAYNRAIKGQAEGDYCTAAFFFSAKDSQLDHSPAGVFRSLLHQLLPSCPESLKDFCEQWAARRNYGQEEIPPWEEVELSAAFQRCFLRQGNKKIFIFIDALDECDSAHVRSQAYFWRALTSTAYDKGISLNVCISIRHFPRVSLRDCPEIVVEHHNTLDIANYVDQKFRLSVDTSAPQWKLLKEHILARAMGVFLWTALVVDDLLVKWDDGHDIRYLMKQVSAVPDALESLFCQMLSSVSGEDRELTARFFQWVILATKPLRVHEWHHVLAFIRQTPPKSLSEWRASDHFTRTDDQLEKQIRSISKGLVEIRSTAADETPEQAFDRLSICAGAGSLTLELGETRAVSVVHESVREFFLRGPGFETLIPSFDLHFIGNGHLSIIETCLKYLGIKELDALVQARSRVKSKRRRRKPRSQSSAYSQSTLSESFTPPYPDVLPSGAIEDSADCVVEPNGGVTENGTGAESKFDVAGPQRLSLSLLKDNFDVDNGVDIGRWIGGNEDAFSLKSLNSLNGLHSQSAARSQGSCRSQLLEDYPALLSYATYELFTHARLAEENRVGSDPIASRLRVLSGWDRLSALREDITGEMSLRKYCTQVHGLDTWLFPWHPDADGDSSAKKQGSAAPGGLPGPRLTSGISMSFLTPRLKNGDSVSRGQSPTHKANGIVTELKASIDNAKGEGEQTNTSPRNVRRQISIASFGSASSHTGSVKWIYSGQPDKGSARPMSAMSQRKVSPAFQPGGSRRNSTDDQANGIQNKTENYRAVIDSESEEYIDESAIDDDDHSSAWEDSLEDNSGKSSVDEKFFQRVPSTANLTSRRSLISMTPAQKKRAMNLGNQASWSTSAVQPRGTPNGPSLRTSPKNFSPNDSNFAPSTSFLHDSDEGPLMGKRFRWSALKSLTGTSLTRRHIKRRHTLTDLADLKQYHQNACMKRDEDSDSERWTKFCEQEKFNKYHGRG